MSPKDFFVVAINGFPVTHFSEDDEIPYIVQALYGIGPYFVTIDITSKLPINEGFSRKEDITKKSGCDVSSNTFNNGSYTNISGVIYSNADLINLPTPHILGSDFIFVHNRTSMKPINRGWLPIGLEYWIENNKLRTYLFNTNNSSI